MKTLAATKQVLAFFWNWTKAQVRSPGTPGWDQLFFTVLETSGGSTNLVQCSALRRGWKKDSFQCLYEQHRLNRWPVFCKFPDWNQWNIDNTTGKTLCLHEEVVWAGGNVDAVLDQNENQSCSAPPDQHKHDMSCTTAPTSEQVDWFSTRTLPGIFTNEVLLMENYIGSALERLLDWYTIID